MPNRVCCLGESLEPGRYRSPSWFEVPISVEVTSGWRGLSAAAEEVFAVVEGKNSIDHAERWLAFFVAASGPSVKKVIDELRATPMLDVVDEQPVEVAGATGRQLDAVAEPDPKQKGSYTIQRGSISIPPIAQLVPGFWYTESKGARLRFLVLDADGATFLVYIEAPPDDFGLFSDRADDVLGSLRFEPD